MIKGIYRSCILALVICFSVTTSGMAAKPTTGRELGVPSKKGVRFKAGKAHQDSLR